MTVHLSAIGNAFQFFNSNGRPLSLGKLYTYAAGTSTPQLTYTDNTGIPTNTNPIQLDPSGRLPNEVWLTDATAYKFVLQDALGNTIGTYDNITGIGDLSGFASTTPPTGASLVGYKLPIGSSGRTLQTRLQETASVKDFGATGDGSTDDTAAIQAAINACALGPSLFFPAGTYKVSSSLVIPSGVTMRGDGRNFGTIIKPTAALGQVFTIDGSLYGGGFVFRILIADMIVDYSNITATVARSVYMNQAYNVEFRNVFLYNQPASVTESVYLKGCNNIVFDDVIMYGNNSGVTRAVLVDGSVQVSVKFINCDIENYNRGIVTQGTAVVDIVSCYMERCIVCVDHGATAGATNVIGGYLSTVNGFPINVGGPNLIVDGAYLNPFVGAAPGGLGIVAASTSFFPNVQFRNIALLSQSGFVDNTANWLTLQTNAPQFAGVFEKNLRLQKSLASGVTTDLLKIANIDNYVAFKVRLTGFVGAAFYVQEFDFVVNGSSVVSGVTTTKLVDTANSNYAATIALILTPNVGSGYVMVQINVVTLGALGAGTAFTMNAQVTAFGIETGVGGLYIQ